MFAGKSDRLTSKARRAAHSKKRVLVVKHSIDKRYDENDMATHAGGRHKAIPIGSSAEVQALAADYDIVFIDEAQFFDDDLPKVCDNLSAAGKEVIVGGLDLDYRGEPFGPMGALLCRADKIEKMTACCTICGADANRSQRIEKEGTILVGGKESYEARCRTHWSPNPETR